MPTTSDPVAYLTLASVTGNPEGLAKHYQASADTMSGVGREHGLLAHAAAKTEDGLLIVTVWPSREGSEAAARDPRRLEVLAGLDIDPARFHRQHHDVLAFDLFR